MFETWLKEEKSMLKETYGKQRIKYIFIAVLLIPFILIELILLLDGGGAMELCALLFLLCVLGFVLSLGNYHKRFIKPLLASVKKELTTEEKRQEFAEQIKNSVRLVYAPYPLVKQCDMLVASDYCYFRQPKKSRIITNNKIHKILLAKESYSTGTRGHFRTAYVLHLFTSDNEKKPAWKAYFLKEKQLYHAFSEIQKILPEGTTVQDDVAYGKTEEGKRKFNRELCIQMAVVLIVVIGLTILVKLLQNNAF